MDFNPFEVLHFTFENFIGLLEKNSKASRFKISKKSQIKVFENYFGKICPQTIVMENEYVDHDFLEDFAGYYLKCFQAYRRFCSRLHFFKNSFNNDDFLKLLTGENSSLTSDSLNANYLGFIVVKPLPQTIIGRTCLITYPEEDGRCFPINQKNTVNLFGISLDIEGLPFQEQDMVVAACATNALWSIFQYTGKKFHHHIPSPVEITRAATANLALGNRTIPNAKGLIVEQMADAIRSVSLEPFLINVTDDYLLQSTLYAYLRGEIPVILIMSLFDTSKAPIFPSGHAVVVTGYCLGKGKITPTVPEGFQLKATQIDKLYVHDDQIGPYARMVLEGKTFKFEKRELPTLSSSWKGRDGKEDSMKVVPTTLLIPLYNKIRIPFEAIYSAVYYFDKFFETLKKQILTGPKNEIDEPIFQERLVWDIFITSLNDLKSEVFATNNLPSDYKKEILLGSFPKFIWRAKATCGGEEALDLLFDATDFEQGSFFLRAIEYNQIAYIILRAASKDLMVKEELATGPEWSVLKWFKDQSVL